VPATGSLRETPCQLGDTPCPLQYGATKQRKMARVACHHDRISGPVQPSQHCSGQGVSPSWHGVPRSAPRTFRDPIRRLSRLCHPLAHIITRVTINGIRTTTSAVVAAIFCHGNAAIAVSERRMPRPRSPRRHPVRGTRRAQHHPKRTGPPDSCAAQPNDPDSARQTRHHRRHGIAARPLVRHGPAVWMDLPIGNDLRLAETHAGSEIVSLPQRSDPSSPRSQTERRKLR